MSKKAEQIKARYDRGYVTDEQLIRYMELGVISEEEYNIIIGNVAEEPQESEAD